MARMRRKLLVGLVLLGLSSIAPAAAESVPLPKAATQPKEGPAAPSAPRSAASAQPQNPVADLANGLKSLFGLDKAFTPAQRAQIDKVSVYLSSVQQMVGHFVQVVGRQPQPGRILCAEAGSHPIPI